MRSIERFALALFLVIPLCIHSTPAMTAEYNPAYCQEIAGTLNILWERLLPEPGCTGIEYTDGTLEDAADGTITLNGVSVSNASCIITGHYTFTLSPDGLTLNGMDTQYNVPMTLTRSPGQGCFVGHWLLDYYDYLGYIAAAPFLGTVGTEPSTWGKIKALYR